MRTRREVSPHKIVIPDEDIPDPPGIGKRHVCSDGNKPFKILANTIREHGVLNPIHVRSSEADGELVLAVPGHYYRLMAAREADLKKVPVEIISDG
jgi:ParB-like chromosome segregation protein Spo0J